MSKYIFRNEKGGFESAYDKNSLMKLCYEEISDLETKLAEKEKRYEDRKQFCISETRSQMNIINDLIEENAELKQQLAEKDNTIANIIEDSKTSKELMKKQLLEKDQRENKELIW